MTMSMTRQSAAQMRIPGLAEQQYVEAVLNAHAMQPYLQAYVEEAHAAPGLNERGLNGHVLDAKYEPGARCAVLYAVGERLLIGELQWPGTPDAAPTLQLHAYEDDPALRGLRTVLDGEAMAGILSRALPECASGALRIVRCRVTPLRYRLGKRCTLRFDLRLREQQTGAFVAATLYGKLYHSADKAAAVRAEMQLLAASPALAAAGVKLAAPAAFVPELPMLLQSPVSGIPLDLLLNRPPQSPRLADEAARAGLCGAAAALAALHRSNVSSTRTRPAADELRRMQQRSARSVPTAPAGADLHALACALPAWLDCLPEWGAEITLVHGDCKPSQFLVVPQARAGGRSEVAVLDFDHCGMADPAADVGNFLASLRQAELRQALRARKQAGAGVGVPVLEPLPTALEEEFLAAYAAARHTSTNFPRRAAWYEAVALLRKALRSFGRSPRSPLPALLVQEAWRCLAALPRATE
jgi:hypothetical protein